MKHKHNLMFHVVNAFWIRDKVLNFWETDHRNGVTLPHETNKFDFNQWIQMVKLTINSEVASLNNGILYAKQVKSNLSSLKSMKTALNQVMRNGDFSARTIRREMQTVFEKIDGVTSQLEMVDANNDKGVQIPTTIALLALEACQAFENGELDGKLLIEFLMAGGELRKWIHQTHGDLSFKVPDFAIDVESEFRPIRALHSNLKHRFSKQSNK